MDRFKALLPMKGHSKRVPNKNLRAFCGKPLYHWIMQTLLLSPYIEMVYVDTDADAIANDVFENFPERVEIIRRPSAICGDFVSMNVIIEHDLSQIQGDYYLQTHSTNPLLRTETINRAIEQFKSASGHDSLFGVNRIQTRLYDQGGKPLNHDSAVMLRSQDLPPIYEENSNLYLFSRSSFYKKKLRIGDKPILFEIPKLEAVDIDEEADFQLAEQICKSRDLAVAR